MSTTPAIAFNSPQGIAIAADELERWAMEHTEAAAALKALLIDITRERVIAGDKAVMRELKRLAV